jgi:hypothetical protein
MTNVVKVFDFDRSYAKQLKNNKMLDAWSCKSFSQCNKLSGKADMYRLFCGIIRSFASENMEMAESLTNLLAEYSVYTQDEIGNLFAEEDWMCQSARKDPDGKWKAMPSDIIESMPSVEDILHEVGVRAGYVRERGGPSINVDDVYVCNPGLFTSKGVYNPKAGWVVDC